MKDFGFQDGYNVRYVKGTNTVVVGCIDDFIFVDTTSTSITIYLPNIIGSGLLFSPKKFTISDISGNASANNITIVGSGDTINSGNPAVITNNNGTAICAIANQNEWNVSTDAVASTLSGTGANQRVTYWTGTNTLGSSATFIYDGTSLGVGGTPTSTIHTFGSLGLKPTISSASTLSMDATTTHYVFSGTTAIWTLPAVASTTGRTYFIKNRGTGAITLNSNTGTTLYTNSAVGTITINPGEAYILISDGIYFNVQ